MVLPPSPPEAPKEAAVRRCVSVESSPDDENDYRRGSPDTKHRLMMLEKCFCSWDFDKRHGTVPPSDITQLIVTFSRHPEARQLLASRWAEMLTAPVSFIVCGVATRHSLLTTDTPDIDLDSLRNAIASDLAHGPLSRDLKLADDKGRIWPNHVAVVDKGPSGVTLSNGEGTRVEARIQGLPPGIVWDATAKLLAALRSRRSRVARSFEVEDVQELEPVVPASGLPKKQTKEQLLHLCKPLSTAVFDSFTAHVLETFDFLYDCSLDNRRSRALWELFKEWDTKDHGFIDKADTIRRLGCMRFFLDRSINVEKIASAMKIPDDVSVSYFKALMRRLLEDCTDIEVSEVLRTIRQQLQGDDEVRDTHYAISRHLRSEAERQSKRDERLQQLAERRSSVSGNIAEAAKREIAQLSVTRLESEKRHAFDSVTFDDITSLLEAKVTPPAVRQLYEQVATAVCSLLDLGPTMVDGRHEFWPTFQDTLRKNMVGTLTALNEFNPSTLSRVRVSKCMSILQLAECDASHILRHSWLLSALSHWCRTVSRLACVANNWEWPPAPLQSTRDLGNPSHPPTTNAPRRPPPSTARPATAGTIALATGSGLQAARSKTPSSVRNIRPVRSEMRKTDQHAMRMHTSPPLPREIPQSPFRSTNLFIRRRNPRAATWQEYFNKLEREMTRQDEELQKATADIAVTRDTDHLKLKGVDTAHLVEMSLLDEQLGLPQPPPAEYVGGKDEVSLPYWDDTFDEED